MDPEVIAAPVVVEPGPVEIFIGTESPKLGSEGDKPVESESQVSEVSPKPEIISEDAKAKSVVKSNDGFQSRIDEVTRARREAEREAAYWKARVTGEDPTKSPAQNAAPKQPKEADYPTTQGYIDALSEFMIDQKVDQKLAEKVAQQETAKQITSRADSWNSKLAQAKTSIPDFDSVMETAELPVGDHVSAILFEHDHGAHVVHHLALNPEVLEKLNDMSPAKVAFEIASIASKLTTVGQSVESKPVVKPTTKAPAPASTIGQGRTTNPSPDEMSMDDYVKMRRGQGAGWAR